jgi:hypothetical protein|tara:strand:+ start:637 stop:780 length:144 start_codon:yes stop_codon:yes gene_type:complete
MIGITVIQTTIRYGDEEKNIIRKSWIELSNWDEKERRFIELILNKLD